MLWFGDNCKRDCRLSLMHTRLRNTDASMIAWGRKEKKRKLIVSADAARQKPRWWFLNLGWVISLINFDLEILTFVFIYRLHMRRPKRKRRHLRVDHQEACLGVSLEVCQEVSLEVCREVSLVACQVVYLEMLTWARSWMWVCIWSLFILPAYPLLFFGCDCGLIWFLAFHLAGYVTYLFPFAQDPELMAAFSDPEIMAALQEGICFLYPAVAIELYFDILVCKLEKCLCSGVSLVSFASY